MRGTSSAGGVCQGVAEVAPEVLDVFAADELSDADMTALDEAATRVGVAGSRYTRPCRN
jgi:hypothetical protein